MTWASKFELLSSVCIQIYLITLTLIIFGGQTVTAETLSPNKFVKLDSEPQRQGYFRDDDDDGKGDDDDDGDKEELWKIIGITVGIVGLAIILLIIYICLYVSRRRKNGQKMFWTRGPERKATRASIPTIVVDSAPPNASAPEQNVMSRPPPQPQLVNDQPTNPTSPPSFNPHFVHYDPMPVGKNDLPPPYDFAEISSHPNDQTDQFPAISTEEQETPKKSMQTTEL